MKKVLFVGEAHYLNSGFGTYAKEILTRLNKLGKYQLAEFASYSHVGDEGVKNSPWKIYPNAVDIKDPRNAEYMSGNNVFGRWRFDSVCLHFKPDVVIGIRDPWMMDFEHDSPLRDYFSWLIMPTVDSVPQQEDWISRFSTADGVLTYTDWATEVLKEQSGGKIKTLGSASPGVDLNVFKPFPNKKAYKARLGIDTNTKIVGTVVRNQPRKLIPSLFRAFRKFIDETGVDNTFLYLHTSYPDMGWNIPRLLKEFNLNNYVLFSYICLSCNHWFPTYFNDIRTTCQHCGKFSAMLPSVKQGLNRVQLSEVYNSFDFYLQYANLEGFGMGMPEATACGVPIAAVNYSAMPEVVRKTGGWNIDVLELNRNSNTDAYQAIPDEKSLVNILKKIAILPNEILCRMGHDARKLTEIHYNWDNIAKIWEKAIDGLPNAKKPWDAPINILDYPNENSEIANIPNSDLIELIYCDFLKKPESAYSYESAKILSNMNNNIVFQDNILKKNNIKMDYIKEIQAYIKTHNIAESIRCNKENLFIEDYMEC